MAHVYLSDSDEWHLADSDQDIRGWDAVDQAGNPLGRVENMVIDTETEMVDTIVLDDGVAYPASDIRIADGVVYVDALAQVVGEGIRPRAEYDRRVRRREVRAPIDGAHLAAPPARKPVGEGPAREGRNAEYADYEDDFRRHYDSTFGDLDRHYGDYDPAYRFGYDMAYDERFDERDYAASESDLRQLYYRRHGYPMSDSHIWNDVKDAVRHAFDRARGVR